jgi:hypothetical protein
MRRSTSLGLTHRQRLTADQPPSPESADKLVASPTGNVREVCPFFACCLRSTTFLRMINLDRRCRVPIFIDTQRACRKPIWTRSRATLSAMASAMTLKWSHQKRPNLSIFRRAFSGLCSESRANSSHFSSTSSCVIGIKSASVCDCGRLCEKGNR